MDTMTPEVRMANDIAGQFRRLPIELGADAVAGHINRFWDPRMRARLVQQVAAGPTGLDPLVVAAAALLR